MTRSMIYLWWNLPEEKFFPFSASLLNRKTPRRKQVSPGLTALCTNAGAEHAEKRRGFVNIYGSEL